MFTTAAYSWFAVQYLPEAKLISAKNPTAMHRFFDEDLISVLWETFWRHLSIIHHQGNQSGSFKFHQDSSRGGEDI